MASRRNSFALLLLFAAFGAPSGLLAQGSCQACLLVLDPHASHSFTAANAANVTINSCGIRVNSDSSSAFFATNAANVHSASTQVTGGYSITNAASATPIPTTGATAAIDPFANVAAPAVGTCLSHPDYTTFGTNGHYEINPGTYCGGLNVANGVTAHFNPGVYVINGGGIHFSNAANVSGTGVTFYITGSGFTSNQLVSITNATTVNLTAPTSGAYQGMLFFQDRTINNSALGSSFAGASNMALTGSLYFPTTAVAFNNGSSSSSNVAIVARTLDFEGATGINFNPAAAIVLPPVSVAVTPGAATLYGGQTQQFTAAVTAGCNSTVTWSLNAGAPGSINAAGLYTAPATVASQQTVTVTATSQSDTTKTATSTITLMPPVAISVAPLSATLYASQTQQFTATVTNTGNPAVTWAVITGSGTISATGLYTAPASIVTQQAATIRATSQADVTKTATATVTLMPPVTISVSPSSATLYSNQTQQFTATVGNTANTAVTWAVVTGPGTVSATGLYTAPAGIATQQAVTVRATSQADATKTATAAVTLLPPVTVSIAPPAVNLNGGQTQQFTATVTNAANTNVTWSIPAGAAGSISAAGLYTAPATIAAQQTVTVTATSQFDGTATGTAVITLLPVTVSVAPLSTTLYATQTQQFTATVANTSNTLVTWAVTAGPGAISAAGLYTAPAGIATQQPATITATSQADPAKTATATVTLMPPITVTVAPSTALLYANQTQQFTPTVTNTSNTGVTWTVTAGPGTVSASGLYTAPATIASQTSVTLTAKSQADNTTVGAAIITLMPPITVTVAPSTATLYANQTQQFTPTVTNTSNTGVTWTVTAGPGTVSASGLYTAPASIASQTSVTVTAKSQADNTTTGTAIITLMPPIIVTVGPSTVLLYANQTQQFTQTVTNASNTGVTWTVTAGAGTVSASGLYTAPATIASQTSVTLTAKSQADNTTVGAAIITLMPPITVTVAPSTATLYANQTQQFTPTVTNTSDTGVTWTVTAGPGTVSASGLYTAPASIASQTSVTVTAKSQADNTTTGAAIITLMPPITVTVAPSTATLYANQTQQFTPTVTNTSNTNVTWTVTAGPGTISASGLYTAPASIASQTSVTVTAKSQADNTTTGTATVTLSPPITVSVAPPTKSLDGGQTQPFTATVTNAPNTAVNWSIPAGAAGSISAAGLYTAPAIIASQQTVTVTATSQQDGTTTGTAVVTLMPITVSVAPPSATLYGGQTQQFTPTVTNTGNTNVTWTVTPGLGTISAAGLYTAPASIATQQTATVTAASEADPTKTATATITLMPPITVSVAPPTATLYGGQTRAFTATVTNASNTTVTWTVTAGPGTISATGLYTAPATIASQTAVTVTAKSNADNTTVGNAAITLMPPITVSVAPPTKTLYGSQTQLFTATVANATDLSVTWSIPAGAAGSINATTGLYTAPATVASEQTVTVTATSQADNATTGTAIVTLKPPITVSVAPPTKTLYGGQTQQFTATVVNATDTSVTWSIPGSAPGSISATGLYTGPATVATQQTVIVTATSQADNTTTGTATITLKPPITVSVAPPTKTLYGGQTQLFTATVVNADNIAVNWSIPAAAPGSIDAAGLYTAPATIATEQTVTVTATSQADNTTTGTATITLKPPITVSVAPPTANLYGGQTQQFTATVSNAANTAVTWSIPISAPGAISATGLYTAPGVVATQQAVVVTAKSQEDNTTVGTSLVTLNSSFTNGYSYRRPIIIDHTKVANTDQTNFPVLISGTYNYLATVANGGKVQNANGYDIIFTSDCAGTQKLDHEIESYRATDGTVSLWARIPTLSHTADTIIYLWYGNSTIAASQENKSGLWDSNYKDVLHLGETSGTTVFDSTVAGNTGTKVSASSPAAIAAGKIGGAQSFNGTSDYIALQPAVTSGAATFSVSLWVKTTANGSNGTYWNRPQLVGDSTNADHSGDYGIVTNAGALGMWGGLNSGGDNSFLTGTLINDGAWHHLAAVNTGTVLRLYLDGKDTGQTLSSGLPLDTYGWYLGAQHYYQGGAAFYHQGSIDEFRFSTSARGGDWIATEFNSQNSPATFYTVYPENVNSIAPPNAFVNSFHTQQFTPILLNCATAVTWTLDPAIGSISASGLYTAPSLASQQTITVTVTDQADPLQTASVTMTVAPPITVTPVPSSATLYGGQSQQFTATVANAATGGVIWSLSPAVGTLSTNGLYTAPATIATPQLVTVTATSVSDPTKTATVSIQLFPPVSISVTPAFSTLFGGQTQKLTATVSNATDTTVTWSGSSVSASGLYTAPATVTTQQVVTLTVTSVADPTKSAIAKVTLTPNSTVYSHSRAITIDHTKIANTDQVNFPVLISGTYSYLANTGAGGQAYDGNGYDIVFTSDAAGTVPLDREIESYDPATGKIAMWVRIPALSHLCDTTIYVFYGNPSVRSEVSNPASVWDTNFAAVYHFGSGPNFTRDSTGNANHCVNHGVLPATLLSGGAGAGLFNGTSSYMDCGNAASFQLTNAITISSFANNTGVGRLVGKMDAGSHNGYELFVYNPPFSTALGMQIANNNTLGGYTSPDIGANNTWQLSGVFLNGTAREYRNAVPGGNNTGNIPGAAAASISNLAIGYDPGNNNAFFNGRIDEVRISNSARSVDWLATEYNSINSPATFYSIAAENTTTVRVCPPALTLLSGQTQQFSASVTNTNAAVTWSNPSGLGTVTAGGLYTAPVSVATNQTISVVATSDADPTKSASAAVTLPAVVISTVTPATAILYQGQTKQFSATVTSAPSNAIVWTLTPDVGTISATGLYTAPAGVATQTPVTVTAASFSDPAKTSTAAVTLMPPVTVDVTPATVSLLNGGTQQFSAAVGNTSNTAVTWSIVPVGTGTITSTGFYTAPITAVFGPISVVATSVFDNTKSGSATLIISPPPTGTYAYRRPIVIDRTKIPNTDQADFPVLISGVYPYLATVSNGGKVQSASGFDIVFTSDCAGAQKLDHEIESYNPVTGAVSMWVRVPLVSHSTDTIFYLNYGSPAITTSQENRAGVWDSNFQSVLHLGNYADSTANAFTGSGTSAAAAGKIGAAQTFDGVSQSITYSSSPSPAGAISLEAWIKTTDTGVKGIFGKQAYQLLYGAGRFRATDATDVTVTGSTPINDGNWHHLAATAPTTGTVSLYVDGVLSGTFNNTHSLLATAADSLLVGSPMNGSLDEVRISSAVRSGDWIGAGFNNQNSPATFYTIYPENANSVIPASTLLSSGQAQQFTAALMAVPGPTTTNPLVLLGTAATPSNAESLALNGNYAYVCDDEEVSVIDITNPTNPRRISTATSSGIHNSRLNFCFVRNGKLVSFADAFNSAIAGSPFFNAFDLTNPAQPTLNATTPFNRRFFSAPSYVGNTAFVPTGAYNYTLCCLDQAHGQVVATDTTNPANPQILGTLLSPDNGTSGPQSGFIYGATLYNPQTLYVAGSTAIEGFANWNNGTGKLIVADITNPAAMSVVTQVNIPGTINLYAPVIQGSLAIALGDNGGVNTIDLPGPNEPINHGHIVVTTFNLADPLHPVIIASVTSPTYIPGLGGGAARIGNNLFLFGGVRDASNHEVMLLVDTTNPASPVLTSYPVFAPITAMVVAGNILHTSNFSGGYAAYQIPGVGAAQYTPLAGSCGTPVTWTLNPSGVGNINASGLYTAPATFTPQTIAVTGTSGAQSATGSITLSNTLTITLSAVTPAPYVVNGPATFLATVTNALGVPVTGSSVSLTGIAGSGSVLTDANGRATFTYTNAARGADTLIASIGTNTSNSLSLFWLNPTNAVTTTLITGNFGSFTQNFPDLMFTGSTDTVLDGAGASVGTIALQQSATTATFRGSFVVKQAGPYTFTNAVSIPSLNFNGTAVNFPAPGSYAYQVDATIGGTLNFNIRPVNPLSITTSTPNRAYGQSVTYTIVAKDETGAPAAQVPLNITVTGPNARVVVATTDATGTATLTYTGASVSGGDVVQATSATAISNQTPVTWISDQVPQITVSGDAVVTLPATGTYTATVTHLGTGLTLAWTQVSGPGASIFDAPSQAVTHVLYPVPGSYVLKITATDSQGTNSLEIPVTVAPPVTASQGWIGSPIDHSQVTGIVGITVAAGTTLTSGTLSYYPVADQNAVVVLNANTTGSGQIGSIDTTVLPNGTYNILLAATDSTGKFQSNSAWIVVGGDYKPGRVTTTVTDLVVPAPGLPIRIDRTYDSLTRATKGDFGYGWTLGINVQMEVSNLSDVTFTINGQRRTFYFTPPFNILGITTPAYTAEPGLFGTLTAPSTNCPSDLVIKTGSIWICAIGYDYYAAQQLVYTDPYGRVYTVSGTGSLQSLKDVAGNTLTVTATGITASNGLSVPFVRDGQGRITKITDPLLNEYNYTYDAQGNLATVGYPGVATPASYTYEATHLYTGGIDPRGNALPITSYYPNGKLQSATVKPDAATNYTTSYVYDTTNPVAVTYSDNTTATGFKTTTTHPDGTTSAMVYDLYGKLISSTDALQHTTLNKYDAGHNLIKVTDPLGRTSTYGYDGNGNRTSVTYPATPTSLNTTSTTTYNAAAEPTQTTDENGNIRTFTYDTNFWPKLATDSLGPIVSYAYNANSTLASKALGYDLSVTSGKATTYAYDQYGNLASETDALGRQTTYLYDALGRKTSMTAPGGGTTTYAYDPLGNLKTVSGPLGRTTSYTYDANSNKISETDSNNHTTQYEYDALNRVTKTTHPDSTTTLYTYDFRNNAIVTTDQGGHKTQKVFDAVGRPTSTTKAFSTPDASTTSYTYYDDGRKATETDPLGHTTTYNYDAAGRPTITLDTQFHTIKYGYDDVGNQVSVTDQNNHVTQQQYDARRRLRKTIYDDSTATQYAYDGPDNLISVTDQAGKLVQYTYDAANQLQSVIHAASPNPLNTTVYGYDAKGNLSTLSDANSHVSQNAFDVLNQLSTETMPAGQAQTRTYDAAGNLLGLTDYNGKTTTYTYDTLNRVLTKTPDATLTEPGVAFTYTATGRRASMTDASGTTTYTYDNLDRLRSKATPQGTLSYTYDAAGNVATVASSNVNGIFVSYTYDNLNRLSTVVDNRLPAGHNSTHYTYDSASNIANVTYPNGLQSNLNYDTLNRIKSRDNYTYQLGPTGHRTGTTEPGGRSLSWTYDGVYRLTNETISLDPHGVNGSVAYGLDPVGNRLSETSSLPGIPTGTSTFDVNDRLTTETYDNNGNTLVSGARTFAYDFENRLKSANGGAVTMIYDGDGNRVAKTASGLTTRYLVDDLNPTGYAQVAEELVSGLVQRTYTYGAQRISQNQLVSGVWTPSFYGYDGLGNVRALTDPIGSVTDTYDYDAWGNLVNFTGLTPNVNLYRGEHYDSEIRVYYLRDRYYDPLSGRFLTRDPDPGVISNPLTLQRYLYAGGLPTQFIDPTGRNAIGDALRRVYIVITTTPAIVAVARPICWVVSKGGVIIKAALQFIHAPPLAGATLQVIQIFCSSFFPGGPPPSLPQDPASPQAPPMAPPITNPPGPIPPSPGSPTGPPSPILPSPPPPVLPPVPGIPSPGMPPAPPMTAPPGPVGPPPGGPTSAPPMPSGPGGPAMPPGMPPIAGGLGG